MLYKNILFIHIPKTGGTSIEKSLYKSLKINDTDMCIDIYKYLLNNNYLSTDYKIIQIIGGCILGLFTYFNFSKIIEYHYSYQEYIDNEYLNEKIKVFSVVRNPYTRLVSIYKYLDIKTTFDDFVDNIYNGVNIILKDSKIDYIKKINNFMIRDQYSYIVTRNPQDIKPKIIKFENIDEDWKAVSNLFNLEYTELMKCNITKNKKEKSWIDFYTNKKTLDKVYEIYKRDFEYFGYDKNI